MSDKLNPGDSLAVGGSITSLDGRFTLTLQADGNLVLYQTDGAARWATGTVGRTVSQAIMQADGNFVLYGPAGPIWATATDGHPGSYLVVQNDGNVVIYGPGGPLWAYSRLTIRQLKALEDETTETAFVAVLRAVSHLAVRVLPLRIRDTLIRHLVASASERVKFNLGIYTVAGLLDHLRRCGIHLNTIIDVGAFVGAWSEEAGSIFPCAQIYMIEANSDWEAALQAAQRRLGVRCRYWIQLLGPTEEKEVRFYRMGSGSSVFSENTTFPREEIQLPMATLDGLLIKQRMVSPILLKLDVQGFELEVLRGGKRILQSADVVIFEVSLLPYNKNAPLFAEVVCFMHDAGFVVYDFCGEFRRQTDNALYQIDVVFVREQSDLRAPRKFWLHEP